MTIRTLTPSLANCGIEAFSFAGFQWPRYVASLETGKPAQRLEYRKHGCCSNYYHAPKPGSNGRGFYLTHSEALGLRWQYADDIVSIRHKGWFTDSYCDQTIRGIVLRLPHGRGFLAGWTMGPGMASSIDYAPIFDNAEDAAWCADTMAEYAALNEREYQETQELENDE